MIEINVVFLLDKNRTFKCIIAVVYVLYCAINKSALTFISALFLNNTTGVTGVLSLCILVTIGQEDQSYDWRPYLYSGPPRAWGSRLHNSEGKTSKILN